MRSLTEPRLAEMVPCFALQSEADIFGKGKELPYDEDTWEDTDAFSGSFTAVESSIASSIERKCSSSSEISTVGPRMSIGKKDQEKDNKKDPEKEKKKDVTLYTSTGSRSDPSSSAQFFARLRRLGREWVDSRAREARRFRI
jgi:hypothetical protein